MDNTRIKICEKDKLCSKTQCKDLHSQDPSFEYKIIMEKAKHQKICKLNCFEPQKCLNLHQGEVLPIFCEKQSCEGANCFFMHNQIYQSSEKQFSSEKIQQCNQYKEIGNKHFKDQNFMEAIKAYDQALSYDNTVSILHSNKSLCYKKLGDWERTLLCAKIALDYDKENLRAQYLVTISNSILSVELKSHEILTILQASLEELIQIEKEAAIKLNASLSNLYYEKNTILQLINRLNFFKTEFTLMGVIMRQQPAEKQMLLDFLWKRILGDMRELSDPHQLLICPISLELYNNPVLTCSGHSYEQEFLNQHVTKNGNIDPQTRKPFGKTIPNIQLQQAVLDYKNQQIQHWFNLNFQ